MKDRLTCRYLLRHRVLMFWTILWLASWSGGAWLHGAAHAADDHHADFPETCLACHFAHLSVPSAPLPCAQHLAAPRHLYVSLLAAPTPLFLASQNIPQELAPRGPPA